MDQLQWSYSSLKDFAGCPKRYHEIKILKNFEFVPTEAILVGQRIHSAIEHYIKDGTPLPKNYLHYKEYIDPILELPGEKMVEHKMALKFDRTACDFSDKNRWVRGIADLIILNRENKIATVVDWKTGSERYPDVNQLKLMALMIFAHFPEVETVRSALVFVNKKHLVSEDYTRENSASLWEHFLPDLERLRLAHEKDEWVESPSALCAYCAVKTCKFNKA